MNDADLKIEKAFLSGVALGLLLGTFLMFAVCSFQYDHAPASEFYKRWQVASVREAAEARVKEIEHGK